MKSRLKQIVFVALLYTGVTMLSLNLTSCEEGGIDSQPVSVPKLEITAQAEYSVTSTGPRDVKFTITSNTPWVITSDQSWCKPTPVNSTVSALLQEITVKLDDSELLTSRTAILTIQGDNVEKREVKIVQDSKGALSVAMFEEGVAFRRAGETREFTVFSNKDWSITSDKEWLTFQVASAEGGPASTVYAKAGDKAQMVKAIVGVNDANIRRATIVIKNGLEEKSYEVTQEGNQLEIGNAADSTFSFTSEVKTFQILANMAWTAEPMPGSEWITITSPAAGDGNAELSLKVGTNPVFTKRRGQIRIKPVTPVPGLEDAIINVVQETGFWIDGGDGSVAFTEAGAAVISGTSAGEGKKARLVSNLTYKLGTYTWKFASVDIPQGSKGYFDINGWPNVGNTNYHIFLKNENPTFSIGGGFNWDWANNKVDLANGRLNEMKELTLKVLPDPDLDGKVIFRLYFNDELVVERKNLTNAYLDPEVGGVVLYFGLFDGAGTIVIESFTATPVE